MTSNKIALILLILGLKTMVVAQKAPETLVINGANLLKNQALIVANDAAKKTALTDLLRQADKIIKKGKFYSVMDKTVVPPSGDKHDYMSQAPYWWADSTKPNGLPYIRRDGERNPELNKISDHELMDKMEEEAQTLALAYYFSKQERYAKHAARLLKTWFLDKKTLQNPHLNFGQGIPGINTGRGIGIIETRELHKVTDAAILLRGSKNWSENNHIALKKWFSDYLTWLQDSPIGKDEADEHNNHGTHYDVQIVTCALFTDKMDVAKRQMDTTKNRIKSQLATDGSQPHELTRTVSWGYVNMNLLAFLKTAQMGEKIGIDLWQYETTDGKSLRKAIDWLLPYAKKEQKWTYQQIKKKGYEDTVKVFRTAANVYKNADYDAAAKTIDNAEFMSAFCQLVF